MAARLSAPAGAYALHQNSEINVTPFVDIMLVLLIVMMVAIPAATVSHDLDLARTEAAATPADAPLVVTLKESGALYIGERPVTLAALPAALAEITPGQAPSRQRVYVQAERLVRYERFMAVMNTLQNNGYQHVGLVAEEL